MTGLAASSASSPSGSSRTTEGCLCRMPSARGELGLELEVGERRAGFRGGGSSLVSTGVKFGLGFLLAVVSAVTGRIGSGWTGMKVRVLGSYVGAATVGEGGSVSCGCSRGLATNVREFGSYTMTASGDSSCDASDRMLCAVLGLAFAAFFVPVG